MDKKGIIYIRDNELCKLKNVYKLGITSSYKNRDDSYITYEHERGSFIFVVEIPLDKLSLIDKLLKNYLSQYNSYIGGGTEYYYRSIIHIIPRYLSSLKLDYKILSKEEIDFLERCERLRSLPNRERLKSIFNNLNVINILQRLRQNKIAIDQKSNEAIDQPIIQIEPNQHQKDILHIISDFYNNNTKGKLIWACGLGKALLSILIVKLFMFKTVLVGVPSVHLQTQFKKEIMKVFPDEKNILLIGGNNNLMLHNKTIEDVINKLFLYTGTKFIISTYHSCDKLENIKFDFKIGDEAHHLVGAHTDKGFRAFHNIHSTKTLFMTATEKIIQNKTTGYSMDDENTFGKYIDIKTVYWAIENKKITDYHILVLKNTEDIVDRIISKLKLKVSNRELFISSYMCLKSLEKYTDLTHILLYTNTIIDANQAKQFINELLGLNITSIQKDQIYNDALCSDTCKDLTTEVYKFKNKPLGIISCVYIFGEGFDLPKLNGVCIAGNMHSETRIIQYLLRPNRLDAERPNKKSYIIIPYIDTEDTNCSYEKVRDIISKMRIYDESIEQKISLLTNSKEYINLNTDKKEITPQYTIEESNEELDKLKIRLKYSKALHSKCSEEQDEYNYIKSINMSLHIKSMTDYKESKTKHENYIDDPPNYFMKKAVWKNWYDFIGMDTSSLIPNKDQWLSFCKEKNINNKDQYELACKIYNCLPKDPAELYLGFSNITSELTIRTRR